MFRSSQTAGQTRRVRSRRAIHCGLVAFASMFVLIGPVAVSAADSGDPPPGNRAPSILLVVLDTVRADAVSAYGRVEGTTPSFDALASEGVRYTQTFAPAPWTLPSHATIFSGLRVDEHRVAMPGRPELPDGIETLAEVLSDAGYETAAFSENAIVSDLFELLRGFDVRVTTTVDEENKEVLVDAGAEFRKWIGARDPKKPFFAFVNILDAHRPYTVRSENPWVPAGTSPELIKNRPSAPERLICGALPAPEQIETLRGLYLGDVHAADGKLGLIVEAARRATSARRLITVATSDHGELFGEDMLLGHEFSLHSGLLRVPLVVHGVESVDAAVVETPVGLEDLMPSLIAWAGASVPDGLTGKKLPLAPAKPATSDAGSRPFFSAYTDQFLAVPRDMVGRIKHSDKDRLRQFCTESNRVHGGMAALIRYPFKYVWYENYQPSLYDLSWDPKEKSDQTKYQQELAEAFAAEIEKMRDAAGVVGNAELEDSAGGLSEDALEALKQLGYVQ
jgi:arylsulfatase A-like enzyme